MPKNYLIGIGGTGARVIEAAVHLCAAGFGPDELSIFLVDPDSGNGNLSRTKSLITNYIKCRKQLQKQAGSSIFNTDIKIPPDEKGLVWGIFPDKGATLANFINFKNMPQNNPELADFASVLFTHDELNTTLDMGFRGHPSIGAVVMADIPYNEYPFKLLFDDLANNKRANDIRVFLVGSVFGGTGAAGFPTLGSKQILKFHKLAKIEDNLSQILLGGALVLPYFSFELNADTSRTEKEMFVTTKDFPIATKAALQYYEEKDLGFDQIYFLGDSLAPKVGKFEFGAMKQLNMPHYIEVASSLAAFDFYEQPDIKGPAPQMLFTACRESEKLRWSDLPVTREALKIREKQMELKSLVTRMTVFCYSFLTYGKRILAANHRELKEAWYVDYFKFNQRDEKDKLKDPRLGQSKEALDDFETFANSFLFWISAMDDNSGMVELIDRKMLVKGELDTGKKVSLIDPEQDNTKTNIGYLLKSEGSNKGRDFNDFIANGLNAVVLDKKITDASSKYLNIFYEAAIKYCKANYNVN
ncbi:MAG: hypothetical protein WKF97_05050 [Chitinophagaceae bacterium]